MNRTRRMSYAAVLALVLTAMLWTSCSSNKSKEQESVASLPELPTADVATLKAVPNNKMLATSVIMRSARPEVPPKIQPGCAADDVTTNYSVEVKYSVTVCIPINIPSAGTITGVFNGGLTPNYKLDNSKLPQELQGLATTSPNSASPETLWECKKDEGPWKGSLDSEKGCSATCETDNRLTLLNTPNVVEIEWYGSIIGDKPPIVQFVGQLHLNDTTSERCHSQNVATPKK